MMKIEQLNERICSDIIRTVARRHTRSFFVTNFRYPDGDHISVFLDQLSNESMFTDFGATLGRLSGHSSSASDRLRSIVEAVCRDFGLRTRNDEIICEFSVESVGADVLKYCQALLQISAMYYATPARQASNFPEELECLIQNRIEPKRRVDREWVLEQYDPGHVYSVDYRFNGRGQPANLFCVASVTKAPVVAATSNFLRAHHDNAKTLIIVDPRISLGEKHAGRLELSADSLRFGIQGNEAEIEIFALSS